MISIEVYGTPIPLKRPRAHKMGDFISVYDPQKKEKAQIAWQIKAQYQGELLAGPLFIDIVFGMPIVKGTSKAKKRGMLEGSIYHIKRPDADNLCKLYLDVLTGILYHDDSQIVELHVKKIFTENPRTVIRVLKLRP